MVFGIMPRWQQDRHTQHVISTKKMGQSRSRQPAPIINNMTTTQRIVLTGSLNSGKSTFFNQFLDDPPMDLVFQWCLSNMRKMISKGALNRDEMDSVKREMEQANESDMFRALTGDYEICLRLLSGGSNRLPCLKQIWDGYLRKLFSQYKFYKGMENMGFVMDHLEEPMTREVCSLAYLSSTGFRDLKLSESEIIVDVGGCRDARRKWSYCFENVKMVLFFASLIEFDQFYWEDGIDRMRKSVELFNEFSNSKWLSSSRIILILTKPDLLVKKMTQFRSDVDLSELELKESFRPSLQCVNKDAQPIVEAILHRYEQVLNKRLEFHIVNITNRKEVKTFMNNVNKRFIEPFISPSITHYHSKLQTKLHLA